MKMTLDGAKARRTFLTALKKCARLGKLLGGVLTGSCLEGLLYPKKCISVSVEKNGFCVVRVSRFLCRIRVRLIHEYTSQKDKTLAANTFASMLSLAFHASKPGKRSKITLVMPKEWVVVRTTQMPLAVKENLARVVAYELDRITPLAAGEAYYDFRIVHEDDRRVQLLVLACPADRLRSYLAALKEHHITVERVTTEFSGLTLIGEERIRRKCRIADNGPVPHKAIGGGLESILPNADRTDLLSRGVKQDRRPPMTVTIALVLLCIGLVIPCLVAPLVHETKRVEEIGRQIAVRRESVRKIEALQKEISGIARDIASIEDFKEKRPMLLGILKEITAVLPKNVWLTRARVTDTGVELEGYAASASPLLSKLEQSKYLKKVEFAMPTTRDQKLKADRFLLKMELEGFSPLRSHGGGTDDKKKN